MYIDILNKGLEQVGMGYAELTPVENLIGDLMKQEAHIFMGG